MNGAYLLKFESPLPFWKERGPSFEGTWIPFTQECVVSSLVEIGQVVLEKIFLKIRLNVFSLFHYHLPLDKDRVPHLNKLESPL